MTGESGTAVGATAQHRWLRGWVVATSALVLVSHVLFVAELAAAGVGPSDGHLAYGVETVDVIGHLPPGLSHVVAAVAFFSVFLAVPAMAFVVCAGGWLLWRARGRDGLSAAALAGVVAVVVLLATWGDELWVWVLD